MAQRNLNSYFSVAKSLPQDQRHSSDEGNSSTRQSLHHSNGSGGQLSQVMASTTEERDESVKESEVIVRAGLSIPEALGKLSIGGPPPNTKKRVITTLNK